MTRHRHPPPDDDLPAWLRWACLAVCFVCIFTLFALSWGLADVAAWQVEEGRRRDAERKAKEDEKAERKGHRLPVRR